MQHSSSLKEKNCNVFELQILPLLICATIKHSYNIRTVHKISVSWRSCISWTGIYLGPFPGSVGTVPLTFLQQFQFSPSLQSCKVNLINTKNSYNNEKCRVRKLTAGVSVSGVHVWCWQWFWSESSRRVRMCASCLLWELGSLWCRRCRVDGTGQSCGNGGCRWAGPLALFWCSLRHSRESQAWPRSLSELPLMLLPWGECGYWGSHWLTCSLLNWRLCSCTLTRDFL